LAFFTVNYIKGGRMNPLRQVILPTALVLGGFLLGLIIEKSIVIRLKKVAARTKWGVGDLLVGALSGVIILWFGIAGIYAAVFNIPMNPTVRVIANKILLAVVVLSVSVVASRVAVGFINLYSEKRKGALPATSLFNIFAKIVVFTIGILIILQSLGISITPIITALGVGALAVALALQDTLANLFAGIHVIVSGQVKPGDYVRLDSGEKGYVTDVTWRNTTIRALPNNMIIVPNSKLASAIITNYYQPEKEMSVLVQVGVSYDSDLKKVEKVTMEVGRELMRELEGGVPEFEPFIRYHTFDDFSINFTVILRVNEYVSQYLIKHEFVKRLHERYNKEGIVIPFPIRTVFMKEGED